jgi:sugar (pentulose or hexulose) kinase
MTLLLAIDAGTTSIKAGLFEPGGRCLGIAHQEYRLETPAVDRAELDPEIYWQACITTVKKVLSQVIGDERPVVSVAVSSQGETLICTDEAGKPIRPAIIWLDNRAIDQAARLAEKYSAQIYDLTGIPEIIPTWPACKILWLKENEPDVFQKTKKYLLVQDFLLHRLTGVFATNGSVSCTSMYFDYIKHDWWEEILIEIGIDRSQLPQIFQTGEPIASLSPSSSQTLGLPQNVMVVGGGMDQCVGAIGAGNILEGNFSETTGAALTIQVTLKTPDVDDNKGIPVYEHSIPGKYLLCPVCPTAGMAFKWFRDTFGEAEMEREENSLGDAYELLANMAAKVPAGSDGLIMLPHLMGAYSPRPNSYARGSFTGFTLTHTRGHFVRSLLEGVAFLLKNNLDVIARTGLKVTEIRSTGGGAKSGLWNQIKADVNNVPVITLENDDTAMIGDAIIAGVASGVYPSIEAGCGSLVAIKNRIYPSANVDIYKEAYQKYSSLDDTLDRYYKNQ